MLLKTIFKWLKAYLLFISLLFTGAGARAGEKNTRSRRSRPKTDRLHNTAYQYRTSSGTALVFFLHLNVSILQQKLFFFCFCRQSSRCSSPLTAPSGRINKEKSAKETLQTSVAENRPATQPEPAADSDSGKEDKVSQNKYKISFVDWLQTIVYEYVAIRAVDPDPHGSAFIFLSESGSAFNMQIRIQEGKILK